VNALVHGDNCRAFEKGFADLCRAPHAIALANGTLALELALRALGIGEGDEVVVSPRSFVASASCVVTCGATPVFADVDRNSQNITAATVQAVVTPKTKAILPVHLAGWPSDMEGLCDLARRHELHLIEDCAQAHGAEIGGKPVGSFGDAAIFSFCTDKIMTTGGEGGLLVLKDEAAWRRAWSYKDHGKSYDKVKGRSGSQGFRWLVDGWGSNWRLTEMQAAIGVQQLAKLPRWLAHRRANAQRFIDGLHNVPGVRLTTPPPGVSHAYYKFYVFIRPEELRAGWTRDRILESLIAEGIPCGTGVCPEIYLEEAFQRAGLGPPSRLPVARELGETSLMFPVDPTLDRSAISEMVAAVRSVMQQAAR
jgi:dTDP-4-amino-4,6-dideoxygalactose transaminase